MTILMVQGRLVAIHYTGTVSAALVQALNTYRGVPAVVGVSGGADSVALLHGLLEVGAFPVVAHFDHALRPDSAEDASWVAALAGELGLPFVTARVDVRAVARRRGWNIEDAARRLRYDFLTRAARDRKISHVLTAHTRRDQAETVLMRLLRGEAVLTGIAERWGQVERPLLAVSRTEVEGYLQALGQTWREDPTNQDTDLTRVWVRLVLMPLLLERFGLAEQHLAKLACRANEDEAVLQGLAESLQPHTPLVGQPRAVLRRWLRMTLKGAGLRFHADQLDQLAKAISQGQTTHLDLPGAQPVSVTGSQLILPGQVGPPVAPNFDSPPAWVLRTASAGDWIRQPGGRRKLSDVLAERRVPRQWRSQVPVLADPGQPQQVQWIGLDPPIWALGARQHTSWSDPLWEGMSAALVCAHSAAAAQEAPVGAVVLDSSGQLIGEGRNRSRELGDMTRHAELEALRAAAQQLGQPYLTDCTLVVTLEPCPMCLGAALEARVGRIVYGAANPKAGALGGVSDLLRTHWGHQPEVRAGYRAGECAALLRRTFTEFRRKR
ncbi:tRNA lysidine(34) synthetase TilS [Deinococcus radiophilus]|uniref:tRNA lysidine(34) synthetase TilS n=1 Tax=Deinococcus radiophilus TaxID=32062 RepID=UPI002D1FAB82|nr:tRNA lysidine(34) synthetase TilS [Deinococcus radiophilus]